MDNQAYELLGNSGTAGLFLAGMMGIELVRNPNKWALAGLIVAAILLTVPYATRIVLEFDESPSIELEGRSIVPSK